MSAVTNLILTFSIMENDSDRIKDVNSFMYRGLLMNLVSADYNKDMENGKAWYGGTKFLEAPIYIGAFNHLDLTEFINHLKNIAWDEPEKVQLIIKEQGDEKFRMVELV